eukprot:1260419-Alexandrium_andersonii.AAC.1
MLPTTPMPPALSEPSLTPARATPHARQPMRKSSVRRDGLSETAGCRTMHAMLWCSPLLWSCVH